MRSRRTKGITIKVTDDEYTTFTRLAAGQPVSAWAHDVVVATVTTRPADRVLLAECLAVRMFLFNLHLLEASGEPLTTASIHRLIQQADERKIRAAQERLASAVQGREP
jgi:hypothetical protein